MVCQGIEIMGSSATIVDYFIYPTTCFYHFYSLILFVIFVVLTSMIYYTEKDQVVKPDIISGMAISSTAVLILSTIMSLITSTNGIPMLQRDIFITIIALWIVIIGVWHFKK